MVLNKIKNIVISKKNMTAKNKEFWEWRCFFYDEKFKETIANKIKINLPQPIHRQYTDEYIITSDILYNIKLRKSNSNILEKLHIKKIIETSNSMYKFSSKIIVPFPISKKHIFELEKIGISGIRKDIRDIASFREDINQSSKEIFLTSVKKEITLYSIKKRYSGLKKKIRFEISDINIKNKFMHTISLKCISKKIIAETLNKFEIDDLGGTDYISFIKKLTRVKR